VAHEIPREDPVLVLASTVLIDLLCHPDAAPEAPRS
jgi:hypothetical protein